VNRTHFLTLNIIKLTHYVTQSENEITSRYCKVTPSNKRDSMGRYEVQLTGLAKPPEVISESEGQSCRCSELWRMSGSLTYRKQNLLRCWMQTVFQKT